MTNHQHSGVGVFLSLIEPIGLILIGIFAANAGQVLDITGIVIAVLLIGVARYLLAATARRDASYEWFSSYLEDATDVENVLRRNIDRGLPERWTREDLVESIQWWFDEDLLDDWRWEQEQRNVSRVRTSGARVIYSNIRHPSRGLRLIRYHIDKKIMGESDLKLLETVAQIPHRNIARMIITSGLHSGLIEQSLETNKMGRRIVIYHSGR